MTETGVYLEPGVGPRRPRADHWSPATEGESLVTKEESLYLRLFAGSGPGALNRRDTESME